MKAVKVMATINDQGQLTLDIPLVTETKSRVEVIVLIPEEETIEEPIKREILEDLRQAWQEAQAGHTISASQLWDGIEDD